MSVDGCLLAVSAAAIFTVAVAQSSADLDLGRAVLADDLEGIRIALEKGADPNGKPDDPYPLLNSTQSTEATKLLLEYGADPNAGLDSTPPLYDAASDGNLANVELLLATGANPDAGPYAIRCQNGVTPLIAAAQNPAIVKLLLEAGADPHLTDCASAFGADAMYFAIGNTESMQLLLSHEPGPTGPLGPTGLLGINYPQNPGESFTVDSVALRGPWRVGALLVAIWAGDSASTQVLLEAVGNVSVLMSPTKNERWFWLSKTEESQG